MRLQGFSFAYALILLAVLVPRSSPASDAVVGEWADDVGTILKHRIKIIEEGESFYRISSFEVGSTYRSELREVASPKGEGRAFRELESSDTYAINARGNLEIYDEDGFIREARRVP